MAPDLAAARRILIVKPSSLGDIVHTLPLLDVLRRQVGDAADIRWLVNEAWAPLLCRHPLLDGRVEFPRQVMKGWAAPGRFLGWSRRNADWRPEVAIDVQGLLRSLLLARACRPGRVIGYSDAREGARFGYDEVVDVRAARSPHAVDRYLALADACGWKRPDPLEFPLPPGEEPKGIAELPDRFVLLHPFSRGAGKSLGVGQVRAFCERLEDIPVVLVGWSEEVDPRFPVNGIDWLNRTSLPELIWLLRRAAWTVSVDSGPMHLAAAVSPRVVSLHTWTDPLKVGPYPDAAWAWKGGKLRTMAEWRGESRASEGIRGQGEIPDEGIEALAAFVRERWEG